MNQATVFPASHWGKCSSHTRLKSLLATRPHQAGYLGDPHRTLAHTFLSKLSTRLSRLASRPPWALELEVFQRVSLQWFGGFFVGLTHSFGPACSLGIVMHPAVTYPRTTNHCLRVRLSCRGSIRKNLGSPDRIFTPGRSGSHIRFSLAVINLTHPKCTRRTAWSRVPAHRVVSRPGAPRGLAVPTGFHGAGCLIARSCAQPSAVR
jgi:hypothetical protein